MRVLLDVETKELQVAYQFLNGRDIQNDMVAIHEGQEAASKRQLQIEDASAAIAFVRDVTLL